MLHFCQKITSFSCLLKGRKDGRGLAELTRLLQVISVGSSEMSLRRMTDEIQESLKILVARFWFN